MGLDMYLTKKTYIGAQYEHLNVKGRVQITSNGKKVPIKFKRISEIRESVAYWRKANAIHNWFIENVQDGKDDCGQYDVSIEQLQELVNLCKKVKAASKLVKGTIKNGYNIETDKTGKIKEIPILEDGKVIRNADTAEDLLPTTSGFFFGSTDYDEYYMADIDMTIEQLEPLIKELKKEKDSGAWSTIYYQSSW